MRKVLTVSVVLTVLIGLVQHIDLLNLNYNNLLIYKGIISGSTQIRQDASPYLNGVTALVKEDYDLAENWFAESQTHSELVQWRLIEIEGKRGNWKSVLYSLDPTKVRDRNLYIITLVNHLPELSKNELASLEQPLLTSDLTIQYSAYLLAMGNYEYAIEWAKKTPNYSKSILANVTVGRGYFYLGDVDKAEEAFYNAYSQEANDTTAFWYGRILTKKGKGERAITVLETALQEIRDKETSARFYLELSSVYLKIGQCDKAREMANLAVRNNPEIESTVAEIRAEISNCE